MNNNVNTKGVIVVDVPDRCDMCKMGFTNECSDKFECFLEPTNTLHNPERERPDWCPLQPLNNEENNMTIIANSKEPKEMYEILLDLVFRRQMELISAGLYDSEEYKRVEKIKISLRNKLKTSRKRRDEVV